MSNEYVLAKGPKYRYHDLRADGFTSLCGRECSGLRGWNRTIREMAQSTGRCWHCLNAAAYAAEKKEREVRTLSTPSLHTSVGILRNVWAYATAQQRDGGRMTCQAIQERAGYKSTGMVATALHVLHDAGYVTFDSTQQATIIVLVPFVVSTLKKKTVAAQRCNLP